MIVMEAEGSRQLGYPGSFTQASTKASNATIRNDVGMTKK